MKVVLLENLRKLGAIGEIIDVKRGYARNFLIPQKKALFASDKNIKEVEKIKTDLNKKDQDKKKAAKEIAEKLKNKTFEVKKLITENKELYGSVKPTEISKLLKDKENIELSSSLIQPVTEIKSKNNYFDYKAKYSKGYAKHILPAKLTRVNYSNCLKFAIKVHKLLGCNSIARTDFIFDKKRNKIFFLETNTQPGLTPISLLPEQASYKRLSFSEIIFILIKNLNY